MKLRNLSNLIVIDEIQTNCTEDHLHFISHLMGTENLCVPKNFPSKIYTSRFIMDVLLGISKKFTNPLYPENFVELKPNVGTEIKIEYNTTIEVTMFVSDDIGGNLMFLFSRDENPTHLYAGICSQIRGLIISNKVFAESIQNGVPNLYIDVTSATATELHSTTKTVDIIKNILYSNPQHMLYVHLPKFGYEELIKCIACTFPGQVEIGGFINSLFKYFNLYSKFSQSPDDSRIMIGNRADTIQEIKRDFIERKDITIKNIPANSTFTCNFSRYGLYHINWSPFPSPFILNLLVRVVRPNKLFPIVHSDSQYLSVTVPRFLQKILPQSKSVKFSIEDKPNEKEGKSDVYYEEIEDLNCSNISINVSGSSSTLSNTQIARVKSWASLTEVQTPIHRRGKKLYKETYNIQLTSKTTSENASSSQTPIVIDNVTPKKASKTTKTTSLPKMQTPKHRRREKHCKETNTIELTSKAWSENASPSQTPIVVDDVHPRKAPKASELKYIDIDSD